MRVIFFGTAEFATPSLRLLVNRHDIPLVVTRPSRPVGRARLVKPPPVVAVARSLRLPVIQPDDINAEPILDHLRSLRPDVLVAVAYGKKFNKPILSLAPAGVLNLHPSLLPLYRGASPIQSAIAAGEVVTGVTVIRMDTGIDSGPMLAQREVAIEEEETAPRLSRRLAVEGAELLAQTLEKLQEGYEDARPQDEERATFAPILKRNFADVDWQLPARRIFDQWRAYLGWPGLRTRVAGKSIKILECRLADEIKLRVSPGKAKVRDGRIFVGTGDGLLEIITLQPAGRKPMSAQDFVLGYENLLSQPWSGSARKSAS